MSSELEILKYGINFVEMLIFFLLIFIRQNLK